MTGQPHKSYVSGAELIAAERERQVAAEGWTSEHDDEHLNHELVLAAVCYARHATVGQPWNVHGHDGSWPWEDKAWKPGHAVADLAKAGALIAAEIDRVQRLMAGD